MSPRSSTLFLLALIASLALLSVEAARLPVLMTPTQRQRRASHHGLSRRQAQASPSAGPTLCVVQCPVGDKNGMSATGQNFDGEGKLICQYDRSSPACIYSANFGVAETRNDMTTCPEVAQRICPNRKRDPKWLSSRQAHPYAPAPAPSPAKRVSGRGGKDGKRLEKKREIWRIKSAFSSPSLVARKSGGGKRGGLA